MRTCYRNGSDIGLKSTGCDGCSPSMINGRLCHETGCHFAWNDYKVECFECGCEFYPEARHQAVCEDCLNPSDDETEDSE